MKLTFLLGPIVALAAIAMASAAHAGGARRGNNDAVATVNRDTGPERLVVVRRADGEPDVRSGSRLRDDDHERRSRGNGALFHGVQLVPTSARPGEPGYGWRYFSDPASGQAVVVSPEGQHYFSMGNGLRPIDTKSFGL